MPMLLCIYLMCKPGYLWVLKSLEKLQVQFKKVFYVCIYVFIVSVKNNETVRHLSREKV